jgi:Ca2+-binding EF-hand superfamily protein
LNYCAGFRWDKYDVDLSGDIGADDVPMLLQDMGEKYTPAEVAIIMGSIDADQLRIAEFPEFIGWWCAKSCDDQ